MDRVQGTIRKKEKIMSKRIKRNKPFYSSNGWTFPLLQEATKHCAEIAYEELGLDCYPNQIEVISVEQMLDAYSSIGLPVMYKHWSFGKSFLEQERAYKTGKMGLAYEIVINSNPCISYLMEENSMTMQTLVIAHAAFGHNHFFKNNNLFNEWTDADAILDYLVFAQNYIAKCEERYGHEAVEKTLDAAHALEGQGIDKYRRPAPISIFKEQEKQNQREEELQKQVNDLWRTLPNTAKPEEKSKKEDTFIYPKEENLLYFLEKKSPILESWQREILRITRKLAQYFNPQRQTKVMNEGFASFTHYYIMNRLWEKGLISDGNFIEFLGSHSGVLYSPTYEQGGFNPYALGFDIYDDIKRICEQPTEEDAEWFPDLVGKDWRTEIKNAARDYRDESFILQFLSPTIMRKRRMFMIEDLSENSYFEVSSIHNNRGYKKIRSGLSKMYNTAYSDPDIQVDRVNILGDRKLYLRHYVNDGKRLHDQYLKVMKHLKLLWGYNIVMETIDSTTGKELGSVMVD